MANLPLVVYLDSSDYSALSDPRRRTAVLDKVRGELLELAKSPFVVFAFSGAHLSEISPIEAKYAQAATARADLLVELCGRNAFISVDRLINAELARLADPHTLPAQVLSSNADWFPELDDFISPIEWADTAREIDNAIKERGLNREQRRILKRQLFKSNQPKPVMRGWLADQADCGDWTDILRLYPMRPEDAKILGRYMLGHATPEQAEMAFLESLRDPRWMMRWFAAHQDELTPITEWLRRPSRDMAQRMREIADTAQQLRRLEAILDGKFKASMPTLSGWEVAQDRLLLNVSNRLLTQFYPEAAPTEKVEIIDVYCPGLSTAVRSLHSALWNSISSQPRTPKESDFADAVHSMYAPYVSIFRADRYMAPHIQKQVLSRGARVISRLEEVPAQIKSLLDGSSERNC